MTVIQKGRDKLERVGEKLMTVGSDLVVMNLLTCVKK